MKVTNNEILLELKIINKYTQSLINMIEWSGIDDLPQSEIDQKYSPSTFQSDIFDKKMIEAVDNCDLELLEKLVNNSFFANTRVNGHSLLHLAVRACWVGGVKHLISMGANANMLDMNMETPIQALLWRLGNDDPRIFEICKLLVDAGADVSRQNTDRTGDNCCVRAIKNNHSNEVQEYLFLHQNIGKL